MLGVFIFCLHCRIYGHISLADDYGLKMTLLIFSLQTMLGDTWQEWCCSLVKPVLSRLMNATALKVTIAFRLYFVQIISMVTFAISFESLWYQIILNNSNRRLALREKKKRFIHGLVNRECLITPALKQDNIAWFDQHNNCALWGGRYMKQQSFVHVNWLHIAFKHWC